MIDFATLPPEVNSAAMYSGAGATPLMSASAAWATLSQELFESAASIGSTVTALAAAWIGPSASAMTRAASSYQRWLMSTALSAEQTASQASAAAEAYGTAFAATVSPPLIAANRAQLAALVATNLLGQNTAAIMATEAAYAEMWAQDAAAMYAYQAESAAATSALPQFTAAPQVANPTTAQAATTSTGSTQTLLQWLLAQLSNPATLLGQINAYSQSFLSSGAAFSTPPQILALFTVLWAISSPDSALGQAITNRINGGGAMILPEITVPATPAPGSSAFSAIRAGIGDGERLGARLSVPPSWAQPHQSDTKPHTEGGRADSSVTVPDGIGSLGMLGALGALAAIPRGGTPTKQQRPEPQYGVTSTVMPRHPYGG